MNIFNKFKKMKDKIMYIQTVKEDILDLKINYRCLADRMEDYSSIEFSRFQNKVILLEKQMSALMNYFKLSVSIDPERTIPERVFIVKDE